MPKLNGELTKIFISAADSRSINVTGTPGRLKEIFRQSPVLRHSRFVPLPVYEGLCHGGHLFSSENISSVVDSLNTVVNHDAGVRLPLLSSATGEPFSASRLGDLLIQVSTELMTSSVHLDDLKAGIQVYMETENLDQVKLFSCGKCKNFQSITAGVAANSLATEVLEHDVTVWSKIVKEPRVPRTYKESKLAVVGMSCRLPGGADDNELFWNLMVDGRDTCTTVPADRFNLDTHYDPTGNTPNATQTPYGNFIDKPGLFDPHFFNMSPREVGY